MSERINIESRQGVEIVTKTPPSSLGGTTRSPVAQAEKKKWPLQCHFCKKEHFAKDCQEVTGVRKRQQIISTAKRCLNCLKYGHAAKNCFSKGRCRQCNGRYNTFLCQKTSQDDCSTPSEIETNSLATSTVKRKANVLLQTAKAFVFGEDRNEKIPVHMLFDSGSQKSYVTEEIKKKLSLDVEQKETVNLNTFG